MLPSFAFPYAFLLLIPLPALLWLYWRRRKGAVRISVGNEMSRFVRGKARWVPWAKFTTLSVAVVCVIVMLAGPRWPDPGTRIPAEGVSIAMVVDVSGTMNNADFLWHDQLVTRLAAAKKVFRLFVNGGKGPNNETFPGRPQDEIGLIVYATLPETACPRTLDHRSLLQIMRSQQAKTVPTEAYTNTGDALAWALNHLRDSRAKRKLIVLLTDGEHNVPPPALTPRQAAQLAGNLQIPIYAIHVSGNLGGKTTINEANDAEEERREAEKSLKTIAQMTNGKYFQAADGASLLQASLAIDRFERQTMKTFQYQRYYEGFVWFGLAGLILIVIVLALEATFWRKTP